ncbi:hypothetical protein M427DRAFT_252248 [Gonapodya prolifera JEL478]|uniref:Myb-like domain-containing protein n=1 Tax=Gonapodya prolifera (strain JEL478) TaxID=1344416 RepID=A0A139AL12_GONPJ|nr:hypothetical protein M427DRAFT_252248 [Gonapodya prolifera JEL478]|eukprot:KXS17479.1 hypothetical protein M427DRAFT_252248 [Gonapodya prolifera JEL478]
MSHGSGSSSNVAVPNGSQSVSPIVEASSPPTDHPRNSSAAAMNTVPVVRSTGKNRKKFTDEEKAKMLAAVKRFMAEHDIPEDDLEELVFVRKKRGRDAKNCLALFAELATLFPDRKREDVRKAVQRLCDPNGGKGKWTAEEDELLRQNYALLGPRWTQIAQIIGRTVMSVQTRFTKLLAYDSNVRLGKFTAEEKIAFRTAIDDLVAEGEEFVEDSMIFWNKVAERMGTRSEMQCWKKWRDTGRSQYFSGRKPWTQEDSLKLLQKLLDLNVTDETAVNWRNFEENGFHWSTNILYKKWNSMNDALPQPRPGTFRERIKAAMERELSGERRKELEQAHLEVIAKRREGRREYEERVKDQKPKQREEEEERILDSDEEANYDPDSTATDNPVPVRAAIPSQKKTDVRSSPMNEVSVRLNQRKLDSRKTVQDSEDHLSLVELKKKWDARSVTGA